MMTDSSKSPKKDQPQVARVPWSNGMPWSNGESWTVGNLIVPVSASAVAGEAIIALANEHWGHSRKPGDRIGFLPFHREFYEIAEVLSAGRYRISSPLLHALTAGKSWCRLPDAEGTKPNHNESSHEGLQR